VKKILTIAASDSGGGAGIQADIKTITVMGAYASSAITAVTAQNTTGVISVHPVPAPFITDQLEAVLNDIGADAVKTGMLLNEDIISAVAKMLRTRQLRHVVVDPVMKSKADNILLEESAVETLKTELIPAAFIITPNLDEASVLCKITVNSIETMKEAAQIIYEMGPKNVLIKGGHLKGPCVDLFFDGNEFSELSSPRINTANTHGTGCTLSAAIATELAKGASALDAVRKAKDFITTAIRFSLPIGHGHGPTNPFANISRDAEMFQCSEQLKKAFTKLQNNYIGHLIPEVQSNFGYAITSASSTDDILGFPGRIIRLRKTVATVSPPEAGASKHIAKIILTAMKFNKTYRSAMNIVYNPAIIERCKALGLMVFDFDRNNEPPETKTLEGSTLEWGTENVISNAGGTVPDIIFDRGGTGKEPMVRILGTDPDDIADKVLNIAKERK
jgi:hydroxymethylpyrimidine kinase / phosphomethylpyrimidine kinase / thiamine-phosphate diphosphorylase